MYDDFKAFLKETKKEVDPVIFEILSRSTSEKFKDLVYYQIKTGGKRVRPALTLLSCMAVGGKKEKAIEAAAVIEIFHNYSLIIDDIIDCGRVRRGEKTTIEKYGQSVTECIGMLYGVSLSDALIDLDSSIGRELVEAMKSVIEGEIIDVMQELNSKDEPYLKENYYEKVEESDYFEMIQKKTASLIQASCKVGGIIGKGSTKEIEALSSYGHFLGLAYQVQDDMLDIFGDEEKFGKEIGKDIKEKKRGNLVIVFTLNESKKKQELLEIMKKEKISEKDINRAIEIIEETDSKKKATEIKNNYIKKAEENLDLLPSNKNRSLLKEITKFLKKRKK